MQSLTYSRDRCVLASQTFERAQRIAEPSKVRVELHAPDCYKLTSWRGWFALFWPGNALLICNEKKISFDAETRCSLIKTVTAFCAIAQEERDQDHDSFKRTKLNDHGQHLEEINQEVSSRGAKPGASPNQKRGTDRRIQRRFPGRRTG